MALMLIAFSSARTKIQRRSYFFNRSSTSSSTQSQLIPEQKTGARWWCRVYLRSDEHMHEIHVVLQRGQLAPFVRVHGPCLERGGTCTAFLKFSFECLWSRHCAIVSVGMVERLASKFIPGSSAQGSITKSYLLVLRVRRCTHDLCESRMEGKKVGEGRDQGKEKDIVQT